jgi:protein SCO1/2
MPRRRPSRPRRITDRARFALLTAVALAVALGCGPEPEPPPSAPYGGIPPFSLRERSGAKLTAQELAGHVWIANFIFTRCPDFCPTLTARFTALQERVAGGTDPIRLVSFTVDPEHDTPEVLREYATRAKAGPNWLFLTGDPTRIAQVLRSGFKVAFADDGPPESRVTHSDRFVLVDRRLQIRGYYHGTDQTEVDRLATDAIALRDAPG